LKRVEVIVSKDDSKKVKEIFDQSEYLYTSGTIKLGNETCNVYTAILPDNLIDSIIDCISKQIDLRLKQNMISVYSVESTVSTHLDRLKEKAVKIGLPSKPLERLVESTERYSRLTGDILIMACFATMVVLAGLFLDNVAIVIGAMLLSPLLGPINAFAVNAVLGRVEKLIKSQFSIIMLLISVIFLSATITFIASLFIQLPLTSQIVIRSTVSLTDIAIAIILGFAGGLALVISIPEILVGVAVAVALLPPAAVSGIGLALLDIEIFLGAMLLTFVNLIGLQLGSVLILWMKGVTPRRYYQKAMARKHTNYSLIALSLLLLILSIIIILI